MEEGSSFAGTVLIRYADKVAMLLNASSDSHKLCS
jgi:hypothetical protein